MSAPILKFNIVAKDSHNHRVFNGTASPKANADLVTLATASLTALAKEEQFAKDLTSLEMTFKLCGPDVKPYHGEWVCECCFAISIEETLPADWQLIFQSAVCSRCHPRVMEFGGYHKVNGGAFAEDRTDPRAKGVV